MSHKRNLSAALALLAALGVATMATAEEAKKAKPAAKAKSASQKAAAPAKAEKPGTPTLTIVEPLKDFGTVPRGQKLDADFIIKNTGTADLMLISVQPGCGCTVADYDKVIKPGMSGKVRAHVDTTAFTGPISKPVTIQTNDPNTPTSQLTIHAVVKPYVEAYPAGFVRYIMIQGDVQTQSIKLYSEEDEPFKIVSIEIPDAIKEYVKVTSKLIEEPTELVQGGKQGQAQYKLDITLGGPTSQVGPLSEKIKIVTNSKNQPEYSISVTGVVRPSISVSQSLVNFGEVAPADAEASRSVVVKSNDKAAAATFQVTRVESSIPKVITAEMAKTDRPGEYEVRLRVAKDAKPGDLDGSVTIYTSDKINPVVTLPIKGTIKKPATVGAVN